MDGTVKLIFLHSPEHGITFPGVGVAAHLVWIDIAVTRQVDDQLTGSGGGFFVPQSFPRVWFSKGKSNLIY